MQIRDSDLRHYLVWYVSRVQRSNRWWTGGEDVKTVGCGAAVRCGLSDELITICKKDLFHL